MKNRKRSRLTRREYQVLAFSLLLIAAFASLAIWLHVSRHQLPPMTSLDAPVTGSTVSFPEGWIPKGEARIVGVSECDDQNVSLFVRRLRDGQVLVTLGTCRRCIDAAAKTHERDGKLICGHCNGAMPVLEAGGEVPPEADCTLIPVKSIVSAKTVNIEIQDLEDALAQLKMP